MTLAVAGLLVALGGLLVAQNQPSLRAKVAPDPYTQEQPEALKKAGYESLGPFVFGTDHTSATVAELLGTEPLRWIETAHFRIGCALPALALKTDEAWRDDWIAGLRLELKRLAVRLPRVKPDVRELDPWLRAHLFAQRAEELYADVLANLGLQEFHFPVAADNPAEATKFRGLGPHLGMREKFTILLVQKGASHARYTRAYQGTEIAEPTRGHDFKFGAMYWGTSEETANGLFRHDYPLHSHFIFNLSHNLYTCYRSFSHEVPPWLVTGLAHWHSRRVTPRFPTFDRKDLKDKDQRSAFWEWDKRVEGLLRNGAFEPAEQLLSRTNAGSFGLEQHMQSWALVDFLMTSHKAKTMQFLHTLKDPFHARRQAPTATELSLRQTDALKTTLGWTAAELDAAWRLAVLGKGKK